MNESLVQFSTSFNYQKVAFEGSQTIAVSASSSYSTIKTVAHGLGYIPSVRVWYDPGLGRRLPISIEQYQDDDFSTNYTNLVTTRAYLTTTTLVIEAANASGSNKNVTLWWRIYYDA